MAPKERTTKTVVDDARTHLRELVDAHIALAKAEMAENQRQLVAGLVPLLIAGVLGLYVLGFFAVTGVKALELVVDEWLAWLIVSVAVTVVAGILGLVGKRKLGAASAAPTDAQQSIQETVAWAKTKAGKDS